MKIDATTIHPGFIFLIENPNTVITLDANILIPPDRSISKKSISFDTYKEIWLSPLFSSFTNIAIHESVYEELVMGNIKKYVDSLITSTPPKIEILSDSSLSNTERFLRNTFEQKISFHTKYNPIIDNKDDRGEVKSLAYIAVKGLTYFAAHDSNVIQLIEKAELWSTGLDDLDAVKFYEILYHLYKTSPEKSKGFKMLYKYLYYLTEKEHKENMEWGEFILAMDRLYNQYY